MTCKDRCTSVNCGGTVSSFSSPKKCPSCGSRLRVRGNRRTLEFRLTCQSCGYQSHLLSPEELEDLL